MGCPTKLRNKWPLDLGFAAIHPQKPVLKRTAMPAARFFYRLSLVKDSLYSLFADHLIVADNLGLTLRRQRLALHHVIDNAKLLGFLR